MASINMPTLAHHSQLLLMTIHLMINRKPQSLVHMFPRRALQIHPVELPAAGLPVPLVVHNIADYPHCNLLRSVIWVFSTISCVRYLACIAFIIALDYPFAIFSKYSPPISFHFAIAPLLFKTRVLHAPWFPFAYLCMNPHDPHCSPRITI